MPDRIIFPEFRDEFETTRYPFADTATLTADTTQAIDVDTFLDACFYPIGGGSRIGISRVEVTSDQVIISISDSSRTVLATGTIDLLTIPSIIRFEDILGRPAGILVSDALRLARFGAWAVGTHNFAIGDAEFVASVVIPTPEIGLRGVQLADGSILAGDVWLVADDGLVFEANEDSENIVLNVVGDPLFIRKDCVEVNDFDVPNFILTINNCRPDDHGNYQLTVGDHFNDQTILRIYGEDAGLVIEAVGQVNTQAGT
jgi:hypothetical protein